MNTEGGGASSTTEDALGSSTATDVSLDRFMSREIFWLDRFYKSEIQHVKELLTAARAADQTAIGKALESQRELAEKHNDLIRAGEKKDETYATKLEVGRIEAIISKMVGIGLAIAFIGIANLVKLWFN